MQTKYENVKNGEGKFTIEVDNATFLKCEDKVFEKKKSKFDIPGFRKGHATKDVVVKMYGHEIFYEDTANECINETYYDAIKDYKDDILTRPEVEIIECDATKNFIYVATVGMRPEFKIKKYKGLEIKKTSTEVTDKDLEDRIKLELEKNSRWVSVDREAKDGDLVKMDFDGYVDDKRFNGGKAEGYSLQLGSHTFIEGFEEQVVGKKIGEDFDVNVTFPENYGEKSLAGKPSVFKCKIHEIKMKEMPTFNDEFASEVSEYETAEEYKKHLKEEIKKDKEMSSTATDKNNLIDMLIKDTDIDISDRMIKQGLEDIEQNIDRRLYNQGMSFHDYLHMLNKTHEKWEEENKDIARDNLKRMLILEKIAKDENIVAGDDLVDEYVENMAMQYGQKKEDLKKNLTEHQIEHIKEDMKYPAVANFLYDNAKFK